MKQKIEDVDHFSLKKVSTSKIERELGEINSNKTTTSGNVPTKIFTLTSFCPLKCEGIERVSVTGQSLLSLIGK